MSSVIVAEPIALQSTAQVETGYRVEVVSDDKALRGLEAAWDALATKSEIAHPFLNYAWFRSWWECFGQGKTLHVVVVRTGTEPIAIAPLMRDSVRMYGTTLRRLTLIENDHTPRSGFVLSRGSERQALHAIWTSLHADERWDVLELNRLPADDAVLENLPALARADGYSTGTRELERSPYISLQGDWESYLKRLGYNHRRNTRKRFNRLQRCGRIELEVVTNGPAIGSALDDGLRIEAAAWKEENGTAMRSDSAVRRFYETYAQLAAAAGTLRLMFLKIDSVRIAFCYALLDNDRLLALKAGYDPAYSRYSPYNQLCYLVLRDCFARGLAEYDFLGNNDAWKLDWEPRIRPHHGLLVFRRAWYTQVPYALKCRLLPLLQRQPLYLRTRDALVRRKRHAARPAEDAGRSDGHD